jgi:hypothetical protein
MSRHQTPARHAGRVRPRTATGEMTVDSTEGPTPVDEAAAPVAAPRRWDGVTYQWATLRRDLRAGARMVRHCPGHAIEDAHAARVVAAGMGLLVLLGAIVTYVAVAGGIDPLPGQPPGGAPPAVVPSVTPTPTADPAGPSTSPSPPPMNPP